ncbi:hypothetical protein NDU88_005143 [Pleurodeles waltl]|uniref:Uncharacterized protein n=1 Tax=Pleurodeles waltl TaxID=8319 RepID=A0AAV7WTZ1_PLEWA|nr:hypothetical protein NDU88_005143 [Pleurodeles waltl]
MCQGALPTEPTTTGEERRFHTEKETGILTMVVSSISIFLPLVNAGIAEPLAEHSRLSGPVVAASRHRDGREWGRCRGQPGPAPTTQLGQSLGSSPRPHR